MRSSPKLQPVLWDALVVAAVVALAVACLAVLRTPDDGEQLRAVVSVDGEEVERISFQKTDPQRLTVRGNGYALEIVSEDGEIWVESSDCPTQDCVHTGRITRGGQSIVCLPARVIVQLEGGSNDGTMPDLVIG